MTKRQSLTIGFASAATLAIAVATGFIHKETPKTPEQCMSELRERTKGLSLKAAINNKSILEFTETPEIKHQHALYADCMERYAQAQNSLINIGFGWK